ncbi:winged helix-turn-helix domain-containing protein [Vibrio parahaemolyticus]|nr:winged helix-turn-helix domain-containing protein [Vibrio parahaemolyticus]
MKEFGQYYHSNSIYYLLDHMGFSWITSRSKHLKQAQEDLRKSKSKRSLRSQNI